MTAYETFILYISLKNHFTQKNYDYFKYNGKSRISFTSFEKRKDRIFFQKLAKHNDVLGFLVSNLVLNNKSWIKTLAYSEEAENIYKNWLKVNQSLLYTFKQDLNKLDDNFNSNFIIKENSHPPILSLFLSGDISLETFCILIDISNCEKYFDKNLKDDVIWKEIGLKVKKYKPFIRYDKEKIKKLCVDIFD